MATWAPPLAKASWRSFSLFYKRVLTWPHLYTPLCFFVGLLALLLLLLHYYSYLTIPCVLLLHGVLLLLLCVSLLCSVSLLYIPPLFCCCLVFHYSSMLHYSLAHLGTFLPLVNLLFLYASLLPCLHRYFPPSFLFCSVLKIWNCLGGSLKASNYKLTINFFCSSLFFWNYFFSFLPQFILIFLLYFFYFIISISFDRFFFGDG